VFYGTTQLATNFTESTLRYWPVRLTKAILFFVSRANPDVERLYPQVKRWVIEVSDDGWPQREVALDGGGLPIFRLPNGRNTGFWTDMAKHRLSPPIWLRSIRRSLIGFGQRPKRVSQVAPNNAFERPVTRHTSARGQRARHFAPSARLQALRPAAQREG